MLDAAVNWEPIAPEDEDEDEDGDVDEVEPEREDTGEPPMHV